MLYRLKEELGRGGRPYHPDLVRRNTDKGYKRAWVLSDNGIGYPKKSTVALTPNTGLLKLGEELGWQVAYFTEDDWIDFGIFVLGEEIVRIRLDHVEPMPEVDSKP